MVFTLSIPLRKTLNGAVTKPAWQSKPSWYLVATDDRMILPRAALYGQARRLERGGACCDALENLALSRIRSSYLVPWVEPRRGLHTVRPSAPNVVRSALPFGNETVSEQVGRQGDR